MIPSTINSEQDYDSILFQSEEKNAPSTPKNKKSRGEEVKKTRSKESKNPRTQEHKKSRVIINEEGKIRRPANIMMMDDIKIALDVLAARRRVWSWQLIDQALREFLERENAL